SRLSNTAITTPSSGALLARSVISPRTTCASSRPSGTPPASPIAPPPNAMPLIRATTLPQSDMRAPPKQPSPYSHSSVDLLAFHLCPTISQRHRPVEHQMVRRRVHGVADEIPGSLELIARARRILRAARLDVSSGHREQR